MIPFIGFAPDIDPTTPGVITSCDDLLPTVRGFEALPASVSTALPALAAACVGAASLQDLGGNIRLIAGTDTKLYESSSGAWADVSRGGNYTSGEKRWRILMFGNTAVAANGIDLLQSSTGAATAFANIAGSPIAKTIDAAAGFVMACNTDATADTWKCCAFQDVTDWTPAVATQCTTGRLIESPGPIRAVRALGSEFVAYKDRAMFISSYVGAPDVFRWRKIDGEIGCPCPEAVVNVLGQHVFVGYEDIYSFNGGTPAPIGDGIKEWFFSNLNRSFAHLTIGMHERNASRVWFFFCKGTSETLNAAIVYNYASKRWGYVTLAVEAVIEYLSGGMTYDALGSSYSTWADLPNVSFDSQFWTANSPVAGIFNSSHTLQSLSGVSAGCQIVTGDYGDDAQYSLLTRARPRFITSPTSGTGTNYHKAVAGDALTTGSTPTMTDGRLDFLQSARWHRLQYDFVGDVEIVGHDLYLAKEGTE